MIAIPKYISRILIRTSLMPRVLAHHYLDSWLYSKSTTSTSFLQPTRVSTVSRCQARLICSDGEQTIPNRIFVQSARGLSALVRAGRTCKRPSDAPCLVALQDILHTRVRTTHQHNDSDNQDEPIRNRQSNVLPGGVPFALFQNGEPEERGEIKSKTADKQTGDEAQESIEKRDRLGNDPSDDGQSSD